MDEVVPANGKEVSIATDDDRGEFWFGYFHSGCEGDGASVSGVVTVCVKIAASASCAADSTDYNQFIHIELQAA